MNRHAPPSLLKYYGVFLLAFFVLNFVAGLIKLGFALSALLGIAASISSAYLALRSFRADQGRGLDQDERFRMLRFSVGAVALLTLFGLLLIKAILAKHPLGMLLVARITPGVILTMVVVGALIAAAEFFVVYYWLNERLGGSDDVSGPRAVDPAPRAAAVAAITPAPGARQRVLVIGNGGREHALAWKLAQSSRTLEVIVAPGNAGTAGENKVRNVDVDITNVGALLDLARREKVDLTVVGPEGPLVLGVVDAFRGAGLRIFGPTAAAAQLEGSKAFAKEFMQRHGIPTAAHSVFDDLDEALAHVRAKGAPIVIKADGLAGGKGVVVAMTLAEAEAALTAQLGGGGLSLVGAGPRVVVEDFLDGEEASFIVMADGRSFVPMATSQDHKRIGDGDTGPNTGGMGAYSPAPVVTDAVHARVVREIIEPTLRGLASDGTPFTGFLYAGLMIDREGAPKVIEYNVRFGDPETQPILMRLQTDLVDLLEAGIDQRIAQVPVRWNRRPALAVVMAAAGYPDAPRTGDEIAGLPSRTAIDVKVFHAATRADGARTLTAGGRVLTVCALGETFAEAQMVAYETVSAISWCGERHRTDIGWRAVARKAAVATFA